ncbi:MAG: PilZ domain-containing protein [Candidatus Omnitrophota bacterium]|nr:PilZ domain-containing protein [Candidatus Omnitrophota bacterium]
MENYVEKRKYQRIPTSIPIKYRRLDDPSGSVRTGAITSNLSEGGVRFRTSEFLSMACRLMLELDIPMFPKPVKVITRVAWIRKAGYGDGYEVGNQFLEISRNDKKVMAQYIDSLILYNDQEIPVVS